VSQLYIVLAVLTCGFCS